MAKDMSDKVVNIIIGIVLVFLIIGNLAGALITGANLITNATNVTGTPTSLPLASLFGASGVVLIIVMVSFLKKIIKMSKGE